MKRLLLLTAMVVVLFTGCKSTDAILAEYPDKVEAQSTFNGFDFGKYTDKGFLITPYKYEGKYKSIGVFNLKIVPQAYRDDVFPADMDKSNFYETYTKAYYSQTMYKVLKWWVEKTDSDKAINAIYTKLRDKGADALVDFDVKYTYKTTDGVPKITIITVSGFAIKRTN